MFHRGKVIAALEACPEPVEGLTNSVLCIEYDENQPFLCTRPYG